MIIDKTRAQIINTQDVYLHDDILHFLHFDTENKIITLDLQNERTNYHIHFENVIGFSMSSCDFWGKSNHEYVLDFEFITPENEMLIPKLREKWNDIPNNSFEMCWGNFFETLFTFSSGNTLLIACGRIEII